MGAVSVNEIKDNVDELATALQLDPAQRQKLGLGKWLSSVGLEAREADVLKWCDEMGAVSVDEVKESLDDLATALQLDPAKRGKLGLEKILGLGKWLSSV